MAIKINTTTVIDDSGNFVNGATVTGTSFVGVYAAGTPMIFAQTAAPTGWTKQTSATYSDKALRIVSGTIASGGSGAFTSCFTSRGLSGSISSETLATSQIPSHGHQIQSQSFAGLLHTEVGGAGGDGSNYAHSDVGFDASANDTIFGWYAGSGTAHNHGFSGSSINFAVQYVDCIYATKD
jgi:hypothetical protein